jgi:hypothetical protein
MENENLGNEQYNLSQKFGHWFENSPDLKNWRAIIISIVIKYI